MAPFRKSLTSNVMQLLPRLRSWLFPRATRQRALQIAAAACKCDAEQLTIHGTQPGNCYLYNAPTEPCWFVYAPWGDGKDGFMLRSSRVIIISKFNGAILYDGSANDEG